MAEVPTRRRGFCLCLAAALAGCHSIDDDLRLALAPTVELDELDIRRDRRSGAEARAVLGFHNPNDWRLAIDAVTCTFVLNGTLLGRTTAGKDRFLPARGRRTVDIVLPFQPAAATAALLDGSAPPRGVGFHLDGVAKVVGLGADLLPFAFSGRWPLA